MKKENLPAWALANGHITQEAYDNILAKKEVKKAWKAKSASTKNGHTKAELIAMIETLSK